MKEEKIKRGAPKVLEDGVRFNIKVERLLKKRLRELARRNGYTLSTYVRLVLNEHVKYIK